MLTYTTPILNEMAEFRHWIAWNAGGKPLGRTLQPAHYGILFYTKAKNSKFYDVRAPHKACRKCQTFLKDYGGKEHLRHPFGYQISDVWDDIHRVRHASKRIENHPCQLPVHLIERSILMTTDPGDLVIDPFCGGGAGVVAAKQMGRNYIGAEIDSYYQRISQEKMDEATATKVGDAYASIHLDKIVSIRDCDIREGLHCQPRAS
jgi:site-specific DNA-methyltransferase (adenine-specific)